MLIDDELPEAELLKRLIDRLYAAKDREGAFRAFCETAKEIGFDGAMLASRVCGPGWREEIAETAYSEAWMTHYVESGYTQSDPLRKYGLAMTRAYYWQDIYPRIRKKELRVFNEAREFGLASGVLIPLYEGPNLVGGLGVASSDAKVNDRRLLPTLEIAGQLFVTVYEEMVRREQREATTREGSIRLTKAELDVLNRMAQGLTNTEIAVALHVSQSSVEYHIANIMSKLKARNRVAAVVMGIKLGFLELR